MRTWVRIPLGLTFYMESKNHSSKWIPHIYTEREREKEREEREKERIQNILIKCRISPILICWNSLSIFDIFNHYKCKCQWNSNSKVIICLEQNILKQIDSKRLLNTKEMKRFQNILIEICKWLRLVLAVFVFTCLYQVKFVP